MTLIARAIEKNNLIPGSIVPETNYWSQSTIYRYLRLGWIKYRGRYILTDLGYKKN